MTARSWNASTRPAERPPARGLRALGRVRERCSTGRGSREYYGLWVPLSKMELSAVGERVFAAESIIKRRIRKVSPRPGLPCAPRGRVGARGPSGRSGPASRAPSATLAPPPPRVPASSPPPPPIFFPFCFSGTYRVPGEMEGVGNQVSIVGSVAWGPGRRQEGTRALGGGCVLASSRCASAPWVFILLFCTRDSAGTAPGNRRRTFWIRGSSQPSSRSELGKLSGAVGRRAGKREKRAGPGSGAREGTHIFWRFLTAGKGNVSCMGPRREDPNPKLSS